MTLDEIRESSKEMLTPAEVAEVLGCDRYSLNLQAKEDIKHGVNSLGFEYAMIGNRMKIPRRAFLRFMEGEK